MLSYPQVSFGFSAEIICISANKKYARISLKNAKNGNKPEVSFHNSIVSFIFLNNQLKQIPELQESKKKLINFDTF